MTTLARKKGEPKLLQNIVAILLKLHLIRGENYIGPFIREA